jgi:RimJ/RimL family protein N-acetyltransferase
MSTFPRIATARLVLRELVAADAAAVQQLAGAREVAEQTLLPHPYGDGVAERWIAACRAAFDGGTAIVFGVERLRDGVLVGAIALALEPYRACAKFGHWVGTPFWGRGYATEATAAIVAYGFETLALERIWAPRFRGNAAAAHVLEKVGLAHEGSHRGFVAERGRTETIERHGCLRWEYFARVGQCGSIPALSFGRTDFTNAAARAPSAVRAVR